MLESYLPELFALDNKVACVTGASSGLGRQAATALASAGAKVVGVARRAEALHQWQAETTAKNTACVVHDLNQRDELDALVAKVSEPFGAPDILVHAAGINTRQAADAITTQGWESTLWLNLSVPFFLSQKLAGKMQQKGWGRIVLFASLQTTRAFPGGVAYGASKGGIGQLTRALAEAWSASGVNVNAIGPGFFPTELTSPIFSDPARAASNAAQTCIGRNGQLSDIDGPCVFLCSQASGYITGQVLMVDGGFTAK